MEELASFYKNKRVLVTGHTGFKGSWLCQILLNFGSNVCGVALKPNTNPNLFSYLELEKKIENHYIDVRDYNKLKKVFSDFRPEIVIHLAAQPLVIDSYNDPRYTYEVNVMGTVNVCECVRGCDSVKSFLNITTDKVYENIEDYDHYYKEDEKLNGYDPYSNSKSCSELVTQAYIKSFFKIPVSTCRAGNVIGGGDFSANRIMVDSYICAKNNKPIILRNPNSIRPYQHVLEADIFYLLLMMKQYINASYAGHYNVGPDEIDCVTNIEIVMLFCKYWGSEAKYESVVKNGPHEANFLKLDSSKVKTTFNWAPKWHIDQAVEKTVELYKAINENKDINDVMNKQIKEYLGV